MYRDYKIVAVTPAGRQRYLELLIPQILKLRGIIDEYHLWLNTQDSFDIKYILDIAAQYPDFIKVKQHTDMDRWKQDPALVGSTNNIRYFFKDCIDRETIYVRFDDDVVWIEPNGLEGFLDYRIDNPDYFIVYPLIINNCGISYILQEMGIIKPVPRIGCDNWYGEGPEFFRGGYHPLDPIGWGNPYFAEQLHREFLNNIALGKLELIKFPEKILTDHQHVSINCFAWFGADFAKFDGVVDADNEEGWFTLWQPQKLGKVNAIYGEFIVSHFAFYVQRRYLDNSDILDQYRSLV